MVSCPTGKQIADMARGPLLRRHACTRCRGIMANNGPTETLRVGHQERLSAGLPIFGCRRTLTLWEASVRFDSAATSLA